jgi:hypothetical protein
VESFVGRQIPGHLICATRNRSRYVVIA